jgi:hypothetical protein
MQHVGSGQRDFERCRVPRPRNHLTCSYGVPTDTENASRSPLLCHRSAPEGAAGRICVLLVRLGPVRLLEDSAGRPEPADPLTLDGPVLSAGT